MTRIRHRACYKLHHLRVIDLAPFKWNVSLGILVEDLKTCFYSFLIFRCLYVLQNSSIALKYISKCRTSRTMNISPLRLCSREQTNGIVVFWNFVVIFAFYNSYFTVVLDSTIRMSACFWLFGVQWLTYDCLWPRDLIDDSLILEALHHYKPILDRRRRTKCSAFKIRRQPITFLLVENEFWVQRHGYETDDLKNNLQTKIFDGEWKRSGFI